MTGKDRPMRRIPGRYEERKGSASGNDGRMMPLREWVGAGVAREAS